MPREIVTVSVGQCGNQLAWRFWDLAVREHAAAAGAGVYSDDMSTFFRNWDADAGRDLITTSGRGGAPVPIKSLRARAVLVDTEEGVVSQVLRSPLGPLFDSSQLLTDVSGAGNNWAQGYCEYGARYHDALLDRVRRALEACESPQSLFFMHSLGGGTGSGLGTYLLEQCADAFPELYRFTTALFPSDDDDVITSPYNFGLAVTRLAEAADCILPIENQALADICGTIAAKAAPSAHSGAARFGGGAGAVAPTSALDYCPPLQAAGSAITRLQLSGGRVWGEHPLLPHPHATMSSSSSSSSAARAHMHAHGASSKAGVALAQYGSAFNDSVEDSYYDDDGAFLNDVPDAGDDDGFDELQRSLAAADALLHAAASAAPARSGPGRPGGTAAAAARVYAGSSVSAARVGGPAASRSSSSSSSTSYRGGAARSVAPAPAPRGAGATAHMTRTNAGSGSSAASVSSAATASVGGGSGGGKRRSGTSWDGMNNIAAHMLTHLTASMRFPGPLNVDLNEITSTLVPFPRLNMLQASLTPLYGLADVAVQASSRRVAAMFTDAFSRGHQLLRGGVVGADGTVTPAGASGADPVVHMAVGLLLRGDLPLSEVHANVERLKRDRVVRLARWNPDGFKVGLCGQPPLHQAYSLLALSNNTSLAGPLQVGHDRFARLYRVRAHVHHYGQFMDEGLLPDALDALAGLVDGYRQVAAMERGGGGGVA
jgi:hypothetical protein